MRFLIGFLFVAGLVSLSATASGQLSDKLPQVIQNRNSGSYLGIAVKDVESSRFSSLGVESDTGVEVVRLTEGSPAEQAGLKVGDILLTYNGENILGGQQLGRLVSETPTGTRLKIKYWRDGKLQTCVVKTAAPPSPPVDFPYGAKDFSDQLNRLHLSMPMDIPTPLLIWRNRFLGIVCEPLEPQLADYFGVKEGVLVRFVEKGSPAYAAGIRSGDVLTSIGSHTVANPRDVTACIRSQGGSNSVSMSLVRNHKPMKLSVTPAEYPQ
jgi:serine protease Do